MATGFVKFWIIENGYGAVSVDGKGRDLFASARELHNRADPPRAGQRVWFKKGISASSGLPIAKNLTVIDEDEEC
jgi:cold shock CspA family protein